MRSLEIDIRLKNGPRVKMATGFTVRRTVRAIEEMIRLLWQQPANRPLVIDIANRRRLLTDAYVAYLTGKLADLGASSDAENSKAEPTIDAWLADFQVSEAHKISCRGALKKLLAQVKHQ